MSIHDVHGLISLSYQLYTAKSQYWLHEAGASPELIANIKNNLFVIIF